MPIYKKMRLDRLMVERGHAPSRSRAADLVKLGAVRIDGEIAAKAGMLLPPGAALTVDAGASPFVSRGGLKLQAAIEAFGFEAKGLAALDIGASTGGFSEVLLAQGARLVFAVDVGRDQLHAKLRSDPRVRVLEETDARRLDLAMLGEKPQAIVADVSFISLLKVLPAILPLAAPGAWLIALVKPQFEAGREAVGKGGIVRDEETQAEAVRNVRDFIAAAPGWSVTGELPSPIRGADGNREMLLGARHAA
jgi:23S rRNA (cytidine1920-2'-O)/16S rRNA (cytidine1409-2'-O)-methyltransferase